VKRKYIADFYTKEGRRKHILMIRCERRRRRRGRTRRKETKNNEVAIQHNVLTFVVPNFNYLH
jgi:hypothetical protein